MFEISHKRSGDAITPDFSAITKNTQSGTEGEENTSLAVIQLQHMKVKT
jgi:hypothetical protein